MPNPNPRAEFLKPNYSKWQHKPIKTIRVPAPLEERIIEWARKLDRGELEEETSEIARLQQELEDVRHRAYRDSQWAAKREAALVNQRDRLEKIANNLKKQLRRVHSIEPGQLLNQLRERHPKSKATLKDVRDLLELCQNGDG